MKKWFVACVLCGIFGGIVFAATPHYEDWRTTTPVGNWTNFLVATGSIRIEEISVPWSVASSTFQVFDTSQTSVNPTMNAWPAYSTTGSGSRWIVKKNISKGFVFTSSGTASWNVLWNFISCPDEPCNPNHTQKDKGRAQGK